MNATAEIEASLHGLPRDRRQVVVNGLRELAGELVQLSAATGNLTKVEAASRAAADAVGVLMTASSRQLGRLGQLLADLRAEIDAEAAPVAVLEANGRLQVLALYRSVEEQSLYVRELEAAGVRRQRLQQLRDQKRLLGIRLPYQRGFLYPRWQFREDLRVKEFVPEILAVADQLGLDAITVHRVMTSPGASGGPTPLELCEQGRAELALNALRTVGELGG